MPRLGNGGYFVGTPAAVSDGVERLYIFARDSSGFLWYIRSDADSWSGWEKLSEAVFASDPAVSSWGPGEMDLFIFVGSDPTHRMLLQIGFYQGKLVANYLLSEAATAWVPFAPLPPDTPTPMPNPNCGRTDQPPCVITP